MQPNYVALAIVGAYMAGILGSMVATIAWFLMGNPYGIDSAYVALVLPLVVMAVSALVTRVWTGEASPAKSGRGLR
jgi:solute:Na+ symporter, SSS family